MGTLYTFYSYKGGVGRSMAMANVAALLSKWGQRVLAIDWDIEAPGLEKYFQNEPSRLYGSRERKPGVVDIAFEFAQGRELDWRDCLLEAYPFPEHTSSPISIMSAGQDTPAYVERAQSINWRMLVNEMGFGAHLEKLREEWLAEFDFVLVDSRTGITDIGGLCTIHLPDVLVLLFTANQQSLKGVQDVLHWAQEKYTGLPFDRPPKLLAVPVPGRFERTAESDKADEWLERFARELAPAYNDWLPKDETAAAVLQKLYVPNIPKWSYGETLPVVLQGTSDPRTIGYAYELLARLLQNGLQWSKVLKEMGTGSAERPPAVVNQEADAALAALDERGQRDARHVLVSLVLVAPASQGEDTRRLRTPLSEFSKYERRVIERLAESRLLTVGRDNAGAETVEITHDATLRHWKQLTGWLDESRDFLLWRQQLRAARAGWRVAGRSPSALLNGAALTTAETYLKTHKEELSDADVQYISVSSEALVRTRRLKRAVAVGALVLALLGGVVGGVNLYSYLQQRQQAQRELLALQQAREATDKGKTLLANGQFGEAITILNQAIAAKSDYAPAYLNRGIAYRNLHSDTSDTMAEADFLRAASLSPRDSQEYNDAFEYINQVRDHLRPVKDKTPPPAGSELQPRAYIHYRAGTSDVRAQYIAKLLKKAGYVVAPIEPVPEAPDTTQVRYFRYDESGEADKIVENLKNAGIISNAEPRYVLGFEKNVRPKHFEIWLGVDTASANPR